GTQTSMTVGLVAVALSVVLGVVLGGISGYFGGLADQGIQRLIELLQSVPTVPIWLALSPALPRDLGVLRDYRNPVTGRVDHARARGARPVSGAPRGRLRARRQTRRLQSAADHSAPYGADVLEPYHRHELARHSGDDHQRDLALFSWRRDPTTSHQLGR